MGYFDSLLGKRPTANFGQRTYMASSKFWLRKVARARKRRASNYLYPSQSNSVVGFTVRSPTILVAAVLFAVTLGSKESYSSSAARRSNSCLYGGLDDNMATWSNYSPCYYPIYS